MISKGNLDLERWQPVSRRFKKKIFIFYMNNTQAAKDTFKLIVDFIRTIIKSKKIVTRIRDVTAEDQKELRSFDPRARSYNSNIINNYYMKCNTKNIVSMKRGDWNLRKSNLEIKRYYSNKAIEKEDVSTALNIHLLESKLKGGKYYDLLSILTDVNYLVKAYTLIKSKPGNMTKGIDKETLDQIDYKFFIKLAQDLKNGKFNFKPGRASMIPKANSDNLRQLTVVSPRDKIVHKAITMLIESIWEPTFSEQSHGFRPKRSPRTALRDIYLFGNRYNWVVQGDITKCFDNIPHQLIMNRISEKIGDKRILELILKYLKAGYILDNKLHKSDKGIPQGGILSPLLANIILDKFDKFLERYCEKFKKGEYRKRNPEYNKLMYHLRKAKNYMEIQKIRELMHSLPSTIAKDPNFKRMNFIRYADDFIVLVNGNLNDAKLIKHYIKEFLIQNCGAMLNDDKTEITNIKDKKWYFLGAEIVKIRRHVYFTERNNDKMRINHRLMVNAPIDRLINKLVEQKYIRRSKDGQYYPLAFTKLFNLDHFDIIKFFNQKINGLLNYYSFASNFSRLGRIIWYLQSSCAYTLASKYKASSPKMYKRFGKKLTCPETGFGLNLPNTLKVKHDFNHNQNHSIDPITLLGITWSNKLTQSTFNKACTLCDSTYNINMHHLKKVADIRFKMRTGNSTYAMWKGAAQRKQIPLCSYHHQLLHAGKLNASDLRRIHDYTNTKN